MHCQEPGCSGMLKVTHTVRAGDVAETRNLMCDCCGKRHTSVTFLLVVRGPKRKRGSGASAVARKVENGHIVLKEEKSP